MPERHCNLERIGSSGDAECHAQWLKLAQPGYSLDPLARNETRSVPEAFEVYGKCVSQQMKMTAEDAQHLLSDCQLVTQKFMGSLGNGWPKGTS